MYVCIHIYIYVYTNIYIYVYVYTNMYIYIYFFDRVTPSKSKGNCKEATPMTTTFVDISRESHS